MRITIENNKKHSNNAIIIWWLVVFHNKIPYSSFKCFFFLINHKIFHILSIHLSNYWSLYPYLKTEKFTIPEKLMNWSTHTNTPNKLWGILGVNKWTDETGLLHRNELCTCEVCEQWLAESLRGGAV